MAVKRQSYFFSHDDEVEFSKKLLKAFPQLLFRDGDRWSVGGEPLYKETIQDCKSSGIYLWNPSLFPAVPSKQIDGKMFGAITRYVIQYDRCPIKDKTIDWRQMTASFDSASPAEKQFTDKVFRIMKSMNSTKLRAICAVSALPITEKVSSFVVGAGAAVLVKNGLNLSSAIGVRLEIAAL